MKVCRHFFLFAAATLFFDINIATAQISAYSGQISGNGKTAPAAVIIDWPPGDGGSCVMIIMNPDGSGSPVSSSGTVGETSNHGDPCRTCEAELVVPGFSDLADCTFYECDKNSKSKDEIGLVCSWGRLSITGDFRRMFDGSTGEFSSNVTAGY